MQSALTGIASELASEHVTTLDDVLNVFAETYTYSFSATFWKCEGLVCINPSSWKTRTHLSCIVSTMASDDLEKQGARAFVVMILT